MREQELLKSLGIWPNLSGYRYILRGLSMIRDNPDYLQCVTKRLYPEIADFYHVTWMCVERAVRTAVMICWNRGNRVYLDRIAGYHLKDRPTVSEFFALLSVYLYHEK